MDAKLRDKIGLDQVVPREVATSAIGPCPWWLCRVGTRRVAPEGNRCSTSLNDRVVRDVGVLIKCREHDRVAV